MQLNLVFLSPPDQPHPPEAAATTAVAVTPWEKLDPAVKTHALEILARLIAAILAAAPAPESRHE
jgi:hypothetical protein